MELQSPLGGLSNMFCHYSIEKLIGLQDLEVKNIETFDSEIYVHCNLKRKPHKCPVCGCHTDRIHDYRTQIIKDCPIFGKKLFIVLSKRRYVCSCGKRFYENVSFLPKYHRMTHRLIENVLYELRSTASFTDVAKRFNLSVSTVIRIFDFVSFSKPKLPDVIAIDEFKGNTWGEKYQCIITDPVNHKVLDILPNRLSYQLSSYFKQFSNRNEVQFFISDMWKTYADMSETFFKNAKPVVDKYHWIRQVFWAFERVRKDIQKDFSKKYRIYFKRSKKLLMKRYSNLKDEQQQQVNLMLSLSPTLGSAYFLKEDFLKVLDCKDRSKAKEHMIKWIDNARDSGISSFQKCANTMYNWLTGILNSFDCPYTNGFTEGCNNKIKVLKRNAYGYRNFTRFRKRILHIFS
jgi:transposase